LIKKPLQTHKKEKNKKKEKVNTHNSGEAAG
jgi:hypothetical protein